jgi:hypothetical protein
MNTGSSLGGLLYTCVVLAKLNLVTIVVACTETRVNDAGLIIATMSCVALDVGVTQGNAFEIFVADLPSGAGLLVVTFCDVFNDGKVKTRCCYLDYN